MNKRQTNIFYFVFIMLCLLTLVLNGIAPISIIIPGLGLLLVVLIVSIIFILLLFCVQCIIKMVTWIKRRVYE